MYPNILLTTMHDHNNMIYIIYLSKTIMETHIPISYFKSHCLDIITNLQKDRQSIIITKRDKPLAKIEAIDTGSKISLFGMLKNKAEIKGNIMR